jgi:uncharacterized protein (DUF58 family)
MKKTDFRPDLLPTIRKLEIHAKRSVLSTTLTGNWISKIRGHGIEFAGYRTYTVNDDASMIDWKASVRSRKLLVKELNEEKNLNIFLLVDVSDSMLFGTADKLKAEYAAELISSFSFAALRGGESVGMAFFSERVKRYVAPKLGVQHHATLMKMLENTADYGGKKDFPKAAGQLLGMMNVPGLIVIISDFVGVDATWERYLKIMAGQHDLICVMVRDRRDRELPSHGEYLLEDPSTGERIVVDTADYAAPYKAYVEQEERGLGLLLQRSNADLLQLETTDDYVHKLTRVLMMRGKRLGE